MKKFFITCAIDYANGDPHHGHAFEKIGADAIARYHRLAGKDVHFLVGMDEHGQKVAQEAQARGQSPQDLVDDIAARFVRMWEKFGISNDQFIRTTDQHHKDGVLHLIERIFEKSPDDFYERAYEGWYCVGCESFKPDSEIADGKCLLHPTRTLDWVKETNWFFRLSSYAGRLKKLLSDDAFLRPVSRRNEMLALLEGGLEDISASRSRFSWGVPFPRPTSNGDAQTTYVWFDALPNYLTATGFPAPRYKKIWPADVHVIGKDIVRFHAVIWPAMLMSAGLPLPRQVWAHGFVLLAGERFSKSSGVKLDLNEAMERHGPDALRYFLLREVPFDGDGNFSWERFDDRYNADLANALGNLASRSVAMVERYFDGLVPAASRTSVDDADLRDLREYHASLDGTAGYLPNEALRALWKTIARGNEYVDRQAPWKLAKDPAQRALLATALASLIRQLARQAVCLFPFMPFKAQELWESLGGPGRLEDRREFALELLDVTGWKVTKGAGLFPRLEQHKADGS